MLFVVVELLLTGGRQRLIYFDHGWLLLLVVVLLSLILAHRFNQGISPVHMRIILVQEGKQPLNLVILCVVAFGLVFFAVAQGVVHCGVDQRGRANVVAQVLLGMSDAPVRF